MITWTSGKAAIAGGWKTLIRGVFSYRYSATSESPEPEEVTSSFVIHSRANPIEIISRANPIVVNSV